MLASLGLDAVTQPKARTVLFTTERHVPQFKDCTLHYVVVFKQSRFTCQSSVLRVLDTISGAWWIHQMKFYAPLSQDPL